jgi:(1->4)-alpha-D-glucan 1-alpha-D-glucosylmutase
MGISHCYASPLLKAREGSPHGYDITDHRQLNQEIGSFEEFVQLAETLKAHGMGLVLDIVPNHMGAGKDNPWWIDVLENGPSSMYAEYFDIDWHPMTADLQGKILLSILGDSYGKILSNGELSLRFVSENGRFWLDYYENAIPINPNAYPGILGHRLGVLETRLGKSNPAFLEYQSIMSALEHLPVEREDNFARKEERARERTIALNRLTVLCAQTPEVRDFIQENVLDHQPGNDDPTRLNRLHRLLEQQAYRLSNWRVASDEINYRRFFDVNDLVAVRVEDARVFQDTHELVMDLVGRGLVHGLRIDHPDGLYDPAGYFQRLQEEAGKRLDLATRPNYGLSDDDLPIYVLIEKILAPFERLPQEWAVHGTVGYEFLNAVNGILVKQDNEREFTRIYERMTGQRIDFDMLVYRAKKLIMKTTLNSELGVLTQQLNRISKQNWSWRDYTLHNLRDALMEVVASFPVYRTYVTPGSISKKDREYIDWAVRLAKRRSRAIDTSIFDFIRSVLLLEAVPEGLRDAAENPASTGKETATTSENRELTVADAEGQPSIQRFNEAVVRFAMKFQQYTGPVMAKGMEDTSFYRYNRLVSLNEVGGEPRQFGLSVSIFHHQNSERARRAPFTLLASATHDTKRSGDVRARISVLSEMPDLWQRLLANLRRYHRHWRKSLEDGESVPSVNDEYLFYQALLGIWPFETPEGEALETLVQRMEQYMLKAVREAKTYTSWINTNAEYEDALVQFIRGVLLKPSHLFLDSFTEFHKLVAHFGLLNSLSQTLLKITCPGVPDIYQGTEVWDFSLVDPDNRRPVDYGRLWGLLEWNRQVQEAHHPAELKPLLSELMDTMPDGRVKQYVLARVMGYRGNHLELFQRGSYIPLEVTGPGAEHVVAFARQWEDQAMIVVAPRLMYTLLGRKYLLPCGKNVRKVWRDTAIMLPEGLRSTTFHNLFNRQAVPRKTRRSVEIDVADILEELSVGVLVSAL